MPRSRTSDSTTPPPLQRVSPRAPLHLKANSNTTTTADSNSASSAPLHHNGRSIRDRSPKLEEQRRSPRSPLPEVGVCTSAQKKRATRVADLETRLSHAQDELRKLREQLASAEAAKKDAQQELQETKKKNKKSTPAAVFTANTKADGATAAGLQNQGCGLLISADNNNEKKQQEQDGEDKDRQGQVERSGEEPKPKVVAADDDDAEERDAEPITNPEIVVQAGIDNAAAAVEALKVPANDTEAVDVTTASDDAPDDHQHQARTSNEHQAEHKQCVPKVEGRDQDQINTPTEGVVVPTVATTTSTAATTNTSTTATTQPEQPIVNPPSPDPTNKHPPAPAPAPAAAEEEMLELETRLWKKDKDLDLLRSENASLKSQLSESEATAEALNAKVASLETSLDDQRRAAEAKLTETQAARAALELEVRRLRVQTEQWRKAADAAAAIISGEDLDGVGGVLGGRKVAERCGSMDKYVGGGGMGFDAAAVFGSPLLEGAEGDSGTATGKRRGIRAFGDLWKKKGHSGGGAGNNK